MNKKDTISIMPDYGNAPYAWLRKAGQTGGVGGNIADGVFGFYGRYGVSEELEKDFAEWAIHFERNVDCFGNRPFDWDSFHQQGIELAKRLHQEIGHLFNIVYVKPCEDPNHKSDEERVISDFK